MRETNEFQRIFNEGRTDDIPNDPYSPLSPPLTLNRMRRLEALTLNELKSLGIDTTLACSDCPSAATCCFAFDGYNTGLDCLMQK